MMLFSAKDMPSVVDDYAPARLSEADRKRLEATAVRLFRAQGNRSGRMRLTADLQRRKVKPPRGMMISTGEERAGGQSLNARKLALEFSKGEVEIAALTEAQQAGLRDKYERAMGEFIRWLAGQLDELRELLRAKQQPYRERADLKDTHARIPSVIADLVCGWETFIKFALESGAISEKESSELVERGWRVLKGAGEAQKPHQNELDPANQFITYLTSGIDARAGHLADSNALHSPPDENNAESYGWQMVERWAHDEPRHVPEPRGKLVGWMDGDNLYLNSESSYQSHKAWRLVRTSPLAKLRCTSFYLKKDYWLRPTSRSKAARPIPPVSALVGVRLQSCGRGRVYWDSPISSRGRLSEPTVLRTLKAGRCRGFRLTLVG
jgi:hypothetical protein